MGVARARYRPWMDAFADDIDVRALQLPGREWRLREPALDCRHFRPFNMLAWSEISGTELVLLHGFLDSKRGQR